MASGAATNLRVEGNNGCKDIPTGEGECIFRIFYRIGIQVKLCPTNCSPAKAVVRNQIVCQQGEKRAEILNFCSTFSYILAQFLLMYMLYVLVYIRFLHKEVVFRRKKINYINQMDIHWEVSAADCYGNKT